MNNALHHLCVCYQLLLSSLAVARSWPQPADSPCGAMRLSQGPVVSRQRLAHMFTCYQFQKA